MRGPRRWLREELRETTPVLAVLLVASGWFSLPDKTACAIYTVAALAILRGKL